jgi:hypothetical protein
LSRSSSGERGRPRGTSCSFEYVVERVDSAIVSAAVTAFLIERVGNAIVSSASAALT